MTHKNEPPRPLPPPPRPSPRPHLEQAAPTPKLNLAKISSSANLSGENALYSPIKRDFGNGNFNGVSDNKIELEADLDREDDHKLPEIIKPWKTTIGVQNNSYPVTKPITSP